MAADSQTLPIFMREWDTNPTWPEMAHLPPGKAGFIWLFLPKGGDQQCSALLKAGAQQ